MPSTRSTTGAGVPGRWACWPTCTTSVVATSTHCQLAEAALTDAKQWGDAWGASMMRNLKASVLLWRGEIAEALEFAERALAGFRKIDDRFGQIQALGTLNRALVALGGSPTPTERSKRRWSSPVCSASWPIRASRPRARQCTSVEGQRAVQQAAEAVGRLDTTGANVDEGRVSARSGMPHR